MFWICSGSWEVLDFGDVVIHVMSEDQRDYYDLEGFYGAAEEVSILCSYYQQHLTYYVMWHRHSAAFSVLCPRLAHMRYAWHHVCV